jgi:hypothetical protein
MQLQQCSQVARYYSLQIYFYLDVFTKLSPFMLIQPSNIQLERWMSGRLLCRMKKYSMVCGTLVLAGNTVLIYVTCLAACLAVTVKCIYSNKADTLQYKTIFDQLQYTTHSITATHSITGRSLKLKPLLHDGNLVSIRVDLELAQVLGAGESFFQPMIWPSVASMLWLVKN